MPPRLVELRVRGLGVIDDVTVELGPGMTALTGETGAGKTLLVEALGLLLGGRADPAVVRAGVDEAVVEGRFDQGADGGSPDGDDPDGEILLARSVVRGGRSRAPWPRRLPGSSSSTASTSTDPSSTVMPSGTPSTPSPASTSVTCRWPAANSGS
jgi:energy-coupling factor transporter ATP-binding protein EcfA2